MKTIWFTKKDLLVGGTELLIERVSKVFQNRGFSTVILYSSIIVEDIFQRYKKANVICKKIDKWDKISSFHFLLDQQEEQYVVTFSIEDFCTLYSVQGNQIKTILYSVYYNQLLVGGNTNSKIGLKLVKKLTSKLLSEMMHTTNIICMDNHTINNTYAYYGDDLNIDRKEIRIVRIPVDIVPLDLEVVYRRASRKNKCNVLTISRADFPWKGYILGLIDYVANSDFSQNLYLHVVTYGDAEKQIINKINKLPIPIKNKITIQSKTDYNELEKLYYNTVLYVGQGTTVLDAAQRGILTIPVIPDTYEVISDAYVHDDSTRVTVQDDAQNNFNKLIKELLEMTSDEYIEKALIGREQIIKNYGTDSICNELCEVLDLVPFNSRRSLYVFLFVFMKKIKSILNKVIH